MEQRNVDIVVISDVHLGTYGSHAEELNNYLRSIRPRMLVLNGDIIDIWQFNKSYFPKEHMETIRIVMGMMTSGVDVVYITGNHDELIRKFSDHTMGKLRIVDKLVLNLDGKKAWIFHGDVFDITVNHGKFIAKLAGHSYDWIIRINRWINYMLHRMGKERVSLSKRIKNSVKGAVKFVQDFELVAAKHAIDQNYDYVICGHIHQPQIKTYTNSKGSVMYLNSGDWIENLTSLEYNDGKWSLYSHLDELMPSYKEMLLPEKMELQLTGVENLVFAEAHSNIEF